MLAARAIRKKKSKTEQEKKDLPRGPYIKPFGPRFDSSELPYFKYGVATQNCTLEMELGMKKSYELAYRYQTDDCSLVP